MTTEDAFSISPSVVGNIQVAGKQLLFIPDGQLDPSTTYTVIIDASANDLVGNPLGEDFTFTFTTRSN